MQTKRLRHAYDKLDNKRINVELRLASLKPKMENIVNVHHVMLGMLGEIFTQPNCIHQVLIPTSLLVEFIFSCKKISEEKRGGNLRVKLETQGHLGNEKSFGGSRITYFVSREILLSFTGEDFSL